MHRKTPSSYFAKLAEVLVEFGIGGKGFLSATNLSNLSSYYYAGRAPGPSDESRI